MAAPSDLILNRMFWKTLLLPSFLATALAGSPGIGIIAAKNSFAMQAAATASLTRTGCLLYKENHFIIQDSETQEVVELNGQDLALNSGNRVQVTGTAGTGKPVVSLATRVFNVISVAPRSRGGCITVASTLGASTEAPSPGPVAAPPQPSKTAQPRKR
jgi:hypothetical protein